MLLFPKYKYTNTLSSFCSLSIYFFSSFFSFDLGLAMKNFNTQIHIRVFLLVVFVFVGPYILCSSQEEEDILTALMEEKGQKALYYAIQGFVRKWWYGSDLYPDPCSWTPIQALPNQQTVDCPSFKLVIVGDGGTGGKWSRGGGHVDCLSEDAKFSDDFDVVYVGSSCSLLVADGKPGNSRYPTS
ncbi:hypothetical protein TEA_006026 [Camellia sinensis var. sinensis]|uniref:Uncharacterized protein n=1 Tax=Camellia sinensis var. sinensis TaxID=542762 RepID=A0A4S4D5J7_CAMSN|nr:hypothetical protein TEA_006026 [Camellia sinensis var. sinensis]